MTRWCYILLLLLHVCLPAFSATGGARYTNDGPAPQESSAYALRPADTHTWLGLQGESLITLSGSTFSSPTPTQFSVGQSRVPVNKNRTRTAFLRHMLRRCQSYLTTYHGIPRRETGPFATATGSAYYIFALRRILC